MSKTTLGLALATCVAQTITPTLTPVRAQTHATPPTRRSPAELVGALHTAFGEHHARAVHTKGIVFEGTFQPDPAAASITKAAHLQKTPSKIVARFSDFTGLPAIPDNAAAANPRGLALRFTLPTGVFTDIVGHSFDGFPTATSDEFRDLLLAIAKSGAGAAQPTPLDQFLATHPIAKTFLTTQKTPASFSSIAYFGVNAFEVEDASGKSHYIRYRFMPVGGERTLTADEAAEQSANYLMDEIRERVATGPFAFDMYAQLAEAGDDLADPSHPWPATRKRVRLGRLTLHRLAANTPEEDRALAFNPLNLLDGIKAADPMLTFRAKAYPISLTERQAAAAAAEASVEARGSTPSPRRGRGR